jgi:hypothetical protein
MVDQPEHAPIESPPRQLAKIGVEESELLLPWIPLDPGIVDRYLDWLHSLSMRREEPVAPPMRPSATLFS